MDNSWAQRQWNGVLDLFGNDDFNVHVWGTFLLSASIYWGLGGLFTIVDVTGRPKALLKYRVQNVKSYPISLDQLIDLFKVVIFNELLVIPLAILNFRMKQWRGHEFDHELPSLAYTIFSIGFFVVCREISFYYSHRLLHHPSIYKYIHKKHHTWTSPVAIAATYAHPVEHVFANLIPLVLGATILQSHLALLWLYILIVSTETIIVHSGFHLPGLMSPEFHDFHHLKFNYNYGTTGWLDWLHGTDSLFKKSKESLRHKVLWSTTPIKVKIP